MSFRVLFYSHDSFGLGHLRRSVSIATELLTRNEAVSAICLTGSPVPEFFEMPPRCDFIKVPTLGKDEAGNHVAKHLDLNLGEIAAVRSEVICGVLRTFRPDALICDHTPVGPGLELLPVLRMIERHRWPTRTILGLRDIIDAPVLARAELCDPETLKALRRYYDEILVYGDRRIMDVGDAYGLPVDIQQRLHYVGIVCRPMSRKKPAPHGAGRPPRILVTVGGGGDGSDLILRTIAALRAAPMPQRFEARLILGPLMPQEDVERLTRSTGGDPRIEFVRSTDEMGGAIEDADLVISMGGYNCTYEALAQGKRLLVSPRCYPRMEQIERAQRLAARGYLDVLAEDVCNSPQRLASTICTALQGSPHTRARDELPFDGAVKAADRIMSLLLDNNGSSISRSARIV